MPTFGATVAIFQWGWLSSLVRLDTAGPLVSFLPILLIGILFGLAMDYEVFLVSRMREDFVHGETAREAVVAGVGHGARVVVAAALIMMSVFAGFVLVEDPIIKSMGFALAFGVARRRLRRAPVARAGGHVVPGRQGLVAAAVAGPGHAQRRHRG